MKKRDGYTGTLNIAIDTGVLKTFPKSLVIPSRMCQSISITKIARLGKGTFGTVDKYQTFDGRIVAIKKIRNNDGISYTAIRELQALQLLQGLWQMAKP